MLKKLLRPFVPRFVLRIRTQLVVRKIRRRFAKLSVQETFERIYAENAWGGAPGDFVSGRGSADEITASYVRLIRHFIAQHAIRSVADLGCGDFRVGQQLLSSGLSYVGVDVVPRLLERNRRLFATNGVSFEQCDLVEGPLPDAELALLRQVLQHLSNAEIQKVLENARHFKYLIVTEHLPTGGAIVPNQDKPHGPDIRIYDRSGVFLDLPPFSLRTKILLEVAISPSELLRTVLIEHP